jgi:hypothetical protein
VVVERAVLRVFHPQRQVQPILVVAAVRRILKTCHLVFLPLLRVVLES